jgi:hypothetical protein
MVNLDTIAERLGLENKKSVTKKRIALFQKDIFEMQQNLAWGICEARNELMNK